MKARALLTMLAAAMVASCQQGSSGSGVDQAALAEGKSLFDSNCAGCHGGGDPAAPKLAALQQMAPEAILSALTHGKMAVQGSSLAPGQRERIAQWLSAGQEQHAGWEETIACETSLRMPATATRWVDSWGLGPDNHRYQRRSSITSANVGKLEKVWSIAFPGAATMRSQPSIIGEAVFLAVSDTQSVYALNRQSGCVYWKRALGGNLRSAVTYADMPDGRSVVIVGDEAANVSVLDAATGALVWQKHLGLDKFSTITGPILVKGATIYVPHSTTETTATVDPAYECCRASGAISANRLSDGGQLWIHRIVSQPKVRAKSKAGTTLWGPAGASVWAAPVIDAELGLIFVGTGPISAAPDEGVGDSILAIDLATGQRRWAFQATANDLWNGACRAPYPDGLHPNCPGTAGVDHDFGAGLIRAKDRNGRALLIAGQKSGAVYALAPATGKVMWKTRIGSGGLLGGVHWGMAVVGNDLLVPVNDPDLSKNPGLAESYRSRIANYTSRAGLYKLDLTTGKQVWSWLAKPNCKGPDCPPQYGLSGAAMATNDIVVSGGMDGVWRAFGLRSGKPLVEHATFGPHTDTINSVTGRGGSIDNSTLVIAGDTILVQSGYGYFGGSPGNMLIAYRLAEAKK